MHDLSVIFAAVFSTFLAIRSSRVSTTAINISQSLALTLSVLLWCSAWLLLVVCKALAAVSSFFSTRCSTSSLHLVDSVIFFIHFGQLFPKCWAEVNVALDLFDFLFQIPLNALFNALFDAFFNTPPQALPQALFQLGFHLVNQCSGRRISASGM
mmetsp:Transcript_19739/g.27708  ORF Transcript_19739/g.27708 Transcript_19739/m.27708 type:complete len:155 (+) Transcript_19739:164-628(+)